ncbi:MAG: 4-(cytidine 5'-diphospho)-2-C-methyl-D-erythritol kinase [Chloroflexi bacterium]|nr:4-(cytidine 5'-diphospho)-2-C-methyl-D-erythritol kinase [Chloroflexota bacterium]
MAKEPPRALALRVYAKVNLTLEVLDRRPDGFHEVRTVLQSVSLADRLTLSPAPDLALSCSDPALAGPDNLALRAARLLRARAGVTPGAHLALEKGIPVAAGLGGGSADAAAALVGLTRRWGLAYSDDDLLPLAQELGSDVPFFLRGGTALASGRGEILEPLPFPGVRWLVLVVPPANVPQKTARLYGALTPGDYRDGSAAAALAEALRSRHALPEDLLVNSFTAVARRLFPALAHAARALADAAAARVHLSGAGPSLFALVQSREHGEEVVRRLVASGHASYLAHTVPHGWEALSPPDVGG